MISRGQDNLLEADVEALVNTVNTIGVMGKGIALQFKKAFPANFIAYKKACDNREVAPGRMLIFDRGTLQNPRYIINFPTKRHWRHPAKIEDIELGLKALVADVQRLGIKSIAVPPLGCGHGGLNWGQVRPRIEAAFAPLNDVDVRLYAPTGAPAAGEMPIKTVRPNMTPGRAAVVGVMHRYAVSGYTLTLLEVQKLLYFLQEAGEPLHLEFERGSYGPYADKLRHVFDRIDGHFIRGWGDGSNKPSSPLTVLPGAIDEAVSILNAQPKTHERFDRVAELIDGFETPYGMELLSSVHWVTVHEQTGETPTTALAVDAIRKWNTRKRRLFRSDHIEFAWQRLAQSQWIAEPSS